MKVFKRTFGIFSLISGLSLNNYLQSKIIVRNDEPQKDDHKVRFENFLKDFQLQFLDIIQSYESIMNIKNMKYLYIFIYLQQNLNFSSINGIQRIKMEMD